MNQMNQQRLIQAWSPQVVVASCSHATAAAAAAAAQEEQLTSPFDQIFVELDCIIANEIIHAHIEKAFEHARYINVHQVVLDMAADARRSSLWWRKAFVVMLFAVCCEPFRKALFTNCPETKRDVALVRMDMEINAWLRGAYLDRLNEIAGKFAPTAPSHEHSASWMLAKFRSYVLQL